MDIHPSPPRTELDLMIEQELARHLKMCRRQLYLWRMFGLIPYFKLGKAVRFRVVEVAAAIERMRFRQFASAGLHLGVTKSSC